MKWPKINNADPHADLKTRRLGPNACHDLTKEPRSILKAAAKPPRSIDGREEFVAKITVAMLDIDKCESSPLGEPRRANEIVDQTRDLVVRKDGPVIGDVKTSVEIRMAISNPWFEAALFVRPGKSA